MSGVAPAFAGSRSQGRAALIGYLPTGFPTVEASIAAVEAMVDAGRRRRRGGDFPTATR